LVRNESFPAKQNSSYGIDWIFHHDGKKTLTAGPAVKVDIVWSSFECLSKRFSIIVMIRNEATCCAYREITWSSNRVAATGHFGCVEVSFAPFPSVIFRNNKKYLPTPTPPHIPAIAILSNDVRAASNIAW
jgi:hypothetical protein